MSDRCPPLDCTSLQPRQLEANNDISGTGVLVGFVGTGYVVLLVLLINYITVYDPNPRHVHIPCRGSVFEPACKPNPIDVKFLGWSRGIIRRALRLAPNSWSAYATSLDFSVALRKSILTLCDVQMVTGLAILVSGFVVMDCGLSSYHWQIMVYLAWFSTVAHMSSLMSIRDYLATRPWQRNIRFLITLILLAMLITAIVPTAYFGWSSSFFEADGKGTLTRTELQALPAACFLQPKSASWIWDSQYCPADNTFYEYTLHDSPRHTYRLYPWPCTFRSSFLGENGPFHGAVFSIVLLVFTFLTRTVKLFEPLSGLASRFLTRPISRLLHRSLLWLSRFQDWDPDLARVKCRPTVRQKLIFRLITLPVLALLLMLRLQVDLFSSMLSELFWLMCILAWGTVKLLLSRNTLDLEVLEKETQWTYGQILPVLLLVMPVLGVMGTFSVETKRKVPATAVLPSLPATAAESDTDTASTQPVDPLRRLLFRESLNMTDHHDSAVEGAPDWLVRNYYDTWWIVYCILFECASISAWCIFVFLIVFGFGQTLYARNDMPQFNLAQFWVGGGGVYSLVTVPLACFYTLQLGLGLDKWLREPGSRAGKHVSMVLFGTIIHSGYIALVLVGPFLPWGSSEYKIQMLRIAEITTTVVGLHCLYTLIVVVLTVIRK